MDAGVVLTGQLAPRPPSRRLHHARAWGLASAKRRAGGRSGVRGDARQELFSMGASSIIAPIAFRRAGGAALPKNREYKIRRRNSLWAVGASWRLVPGLVGKRRRERVQWSNGMLVHKPGTVHRRVKCGSGSIRGWHTVVSTQPPIRNDPGHPSLAAMKALHRRLRSAARRSAIASEHARPEGSDDVEDGAAC
jgi:hypothetical protein